MEIDGSLCFTARSTMRVRFSMSVSFRSQLYGPIRALVPPDRFRSVTEGHLLPTIANTEIQGKQRAGSWLSRSLPSRDLEPAGSLYLSVGNHGLISKRSTGLARLFQIRIVKVLHGLIG